MTSEAQLAKSRPQLVSWHYDVMNVVNCRDIYIVWTPCSGDSVVVGVGAGSCAVESEREDGARDQDRPYVSREGDERQDKGGRRQEPADQHAGEEDRTAAGRGDVTLVQGLPE